MSSATSARERGRPFPFSFHARGETVELAGRYVVSVNDGNAYLEAALVGMGVAQVPAFMAQRHLASGALRSVLTDWTTEPLPLHVVYPPNRHLSNKLRVFVDWIADLFATHDLIRRRSTLATLNRVHSAARCGKQRSVQHRSALRQQAQPHL